MIDYLCRSYHLPFKSYKLSHQADDHLHYARHLVRRKQGFTSAQHRSWRSSWAPCANFVEFLQHSKVEQYSHQSLEVSLHIFAVTLLIVQCKATKVLKL